MKTEINEAEAILTLSLVIADMAMMIDNDVFNRNIINVTNELVCSASEQPLTNDFFNTLYSLVNLLKQHRNSL